MNLDFFISKTPFINSFLERILGIRIIRKKASFDDARDFLLEKYSIKHVIDGGANEGQWAREVLSKHGNLRVDSFEPSESVFKYLKENSDKYPAWKVHNAALGDRNATTSFNISDNQGQSSSVLTPQNHLIHYPQVRFVATRNVEMVRLDSQFSDDNELKYLKLDVQGAESIALDGSKGILDCVIAIEIEIALDKAYASQLDFSESIIFMSTIGYKPFSFSDPIRDGNGFTMFIDGLFLKETLMDSVYEAI
jgi:FkbM family methyltransferase